MEKVRKDDQGTDSRDPAAPFALAPLNDCHVCRSWDGLSSLVPPTIATHYRVRAQNSAEDRFAFNGEYFDLYDQEDSDGKHKAAKSPNVTTGVWRCEFYKRRGTPGKPEGWTKVPIRAQRGSNEIDVIVNLESDSPTPSTQIARVEAAQTLASAPKSEGLTHAGLTQVLGTVLTALDSSYKQLERRERAINEHIDRLEQTCARQTEELERKTRKLRKAKAKSDGLLESIGRAVEQNPEVLNVVSQGFFALLASIAAKKPSSAENLGGETAYSPRGGSDPN